MLIEYLVPESPALPQPNAYDFYLKAADAVICLQQIREAINKNPPYIHHSDSDSTSSPHFNFMDTPIEDTTDEPLPPGVPKPGTLDRLYNTQEKQAVVDANRRVLELIREGIEYDCQQPREEPDKHLESRMSLRRLAQLIRLNGMLYQEAGESDKALVCLMEGLKFGSDIGKGGIMITGLVSLAIQTIVREPIWELIAGLNADDARSAISIADKVVNDSFYYKDVIQEECYRGLANARDMLNSNRWRSEIAGMYNPVGLLRNEKHGMLDMIPYFWTYIKTFSLSPQKLFENYKQDCEKAIEIAGIPYKESVGCCVQTKNLFSEIAITVSEPLRFRFEYNRCMNQMLLMQLGLQLYKLEHDHYPVTLNELAPEYIRLLPMDPFADNDGYRYRVTEDSYILYSIGPDMVDDNGKPIERKDMKSVYKDDDGKPFELNFLRPFSNEDRGDIVAGVNF